LVPQITSTVRPLRRDDYSRWLPLWDGYNAFYGRSGETALPAEITTTTWERFFDPVEPIFALVAEVEEKVVGIAHYLFHRSSNKIEPVCYLQDLFTLPALRGRGIGRSLVEGVYERASQAGARRVYWHTQDTNAAGRALYDKVARHAGFIVYARELER
jgi:GNAT superfamily N-acetyltransferase